MNNFSTPRNEYPRPQLVRNEWINLNGEWEFEKDHSISGKERKLFLADSLSDKINVPFCMESKLSGIEDKDFCECVWYRKEVNISEKWLCDGKRVILNFGACDYRTSVYVNGNQAGTHFGGMVSFSFDITEFVTSGKNILVVCAEDYRRSRMQPSGKQSDKYLSYGCYYTRTTGIWQTVWLENVPNVYVKSLRIYPNINDQSVTVCVEARGTPKESVSFKAFYGKKRSWASNVDRL